MRYERPVNDENADIEIPMPVMIDIGDRDGERDGIRFEVERNRSLRECAMIVEVEEDSVLPGDEQVGVAVLVHIDGSGPIGGGKAGQACALNDVHELLILVGEQGVVLSPTSSHEDLHGAILIDIDDGSSGRGMLR